MAEPGFEPRSFRSPGKYCNHSATEADKQEEEEKEKEEAG